MAFTQDDLDALDESIASGELTVRVNGREVTYRSMKDLLQAKRHIGQVMAKQAGRRHNPLSGIVTVGDRGVR